MIELNRYMHDGAGEQEQAVLAFLRNFNIESSWSDEWKSYQARILVSRWENCREQGYVLMLLNKDNQQMNIAFFEHRNSDCIDAIVWVENTINAPTISTANFGDVYKDKYDTTHSVEYGKVIEMADWIKTQLTTHWNTPKHKKIT